MSLANFENFNDFRLAVQLQLDEAGKFCSNQAAADYERAAAVALRMELASLVESATAADKLRRCLEGIVSDADEALRLQRDLEAIRVREHEEFNALRREAGMPPIPLPPSLRPPIKLLMALLRLLRILLLARHLAQRELRSSILRLLARHLAQRELRSPI